MLRSLRLRNLRSFANFDSAPFVDLKPLTVLVGKNSSGKSSFLRSLPLLRQSVETKTTGPVLWYGSHVDFGAYSEAKNKNSTDDIIYFDFLLSLDVNGRRPFFQRRMFINKKSASDSFEVKLEVGITQLQEKTVAKLIKVVFGHDSFVFSFENNGKFSLIINDNEKVPTDELVYQSGDGFLPIFNRAPNKKDEDVFYGASSFGVYWENFLIDRYFEKVRKYFWHTTSIYTIKAGLRKIGYCNRRNIFNLLKSIFSENIVFSRLLNQNRKEVCDLFYEFSIRNNIFDILSLANHELESVFRGVRYIKPLRATAERYYRHQDLQIDEIDPSGSNLAVLLKSLTEYEKKSFSRWTKENFGFFVWVESVGLHYSIKIESETDNQEYNINDMGFGYSQVLPIIASLWLEIFKRNKKGKYIIFVIEQPELHLHPEYQAKLSILFSRIVTIAKDKGLGLRIIFETHSKTMVDTLGDCIEDKIIEKDDVNIVLFQKESNQGTVISFSDFDEQGYLNHWPVGFFSGRL